MLWFDGKSISSAGAYEANNWAILSAAAAAYPHLQQSPNLKSHMCFDLESGFL